MSNCISIRNERVRFTRDEIDLPRFKAFHEIIMQMDRRKSPDVHVSSEKRTLERKALDFSMYIGWWFLSDGVRFLTSDTGNFPTPRIQKPVVSVRFDGDGAICQKLPEVPPIQAPPVAGEPVAVEITLGGSRSSHTWRDYKQTIALINSFMREGVKKSHRFELMDDDIGGDSFRDSRVEFKYMPLEFTAD